MKMTLAACALALTPAVAFAAGSESSTPPTPTETTENLIGAQTQLSEIRARDGRQTWPEIALRMAIDSGTGPSY